MPAEGVLKTRAIDAAGGLAEFRRQSEHYRENLRFLESRKPELIKKHDKMWIAVYNSALAASSKNLPELLKALEKQRVPEEEALIQYISSEDILTQYVK